MGGFTPLAASRSDAALSEGYNSWSGIWDGLDAAARLPSSVTTFSQGPIPPGHSLGHLVRDHPSVAIPRRERRPVWDPPVPISRLCPGLGPLPPNYPVWLRDSRLVPGPRIPINCYRFFTLPNLFHKREASSLPGPCEFLQSTRPVGSTRG